MRLSDVKGERVFDVVADIIEPIANIASDKEAMGLFKPTTIVKDMTAREAFIKRAKEIAPKLLKNHKRDICVILATIEGVDVAKYTQELTMPKLITGVIELLTDDCFGELFTDAQTSQKHSAV